MCTNRNIYYRTIFKTNHLSRRSIRMSTDMLLIFHNLKWLKYALIPKYCLEESIHCGKKTHGEVKFHLYQGHFKSKERLFL